MLRIHTSTSSAAAKQYYREGLATSDYYQEKGQTLGAWGGKSAELLGLPDFVEQQHFERLADNLHPITGDKLTPRTKSNRRVGYDFTFNAPKSLSIAISLGDDALKEQLKHAFETAIQQTMTDIECDMMTRVRKGGQNHNRHTGNMVWASFTHDTSRPVDGIPDPHLHAHVYAFNTTFDQEEGRWKAGEFSEIKSDAPYFEALFHNRLAHSLQKMGFGIRPTKNRWELGGFSRDMIERFSLRTHEIDRIAEAQGITNPASKAELATMTRNSKHDIRPWHEIHQDWNRRFFQGDMDNLQGLLTSSEHFAANPREIVNQALEHVFARQSVVEERKLLTTALRFGVGAVTEQHIKRQLDQRNLLSVRQNNVTTYTTVDILTEERSLYDMVKKGRGRFRPLGPDQITITNPILNDQQKNVIETILTSRDGVTAIIGKAGVGKTTVLKEIRDNIHQNDSRVYAFAPSSDASRNVLRSEGFAGAETVAKLLHDKKLQEQLKGNVILIDEAGLVGTPTLKKVFDLAREQKARVLLVGDPTQHASVERGDGLRLLEVHSGMKIARLDTVVRQKRNLFRDAVEAISKKCFTKAVDSLEKMGAFIEMDNSHERYQQLAQEYTLAKLRGQSVLAVSPTHQEGNQVSHYIRERLRAAGVVGKKDHTKITYKALSLTDSEKKQIGNYQAGLMLQLNQNVTGFKRGEMVRVLGADNHGVQVVRQNKEETTLPFNQAKRFDLFYQTKTPLSKGDTIRITRNGFTKYGHHRLNNGGEYEVRQIKRDGDIILTNGWIIDHSFGHLKHGYVSTSVASQGKGVDNVFIAQSSTSFGKASSLEQFYVSVSRGKQAVSIFTDDTEELKKQVKKSQVRQSATELMEQPKDGKSSWFGSMKQAIARYQDRAKQHLAQRLPKSPGMTPNRA